MGWSLPLLYLSLEVACDPWSQPTGAEGQEAEVGVEAEEQAGRWLGQALAAVHFLSPSCSPFTALARQADLLLMEPDRCSWPINYSR